jgi:alkylhydroperoxidase family enzyme
MGITEAQLHDLPNYKDSQAFSAVEKLALDYAVAVTRTPVDVPEALFASLQREFNEAQLVELTVTIAWENYRARFDHALAIEAQGFSEGAFCALPETGGA